MLLPDITVEMVREAVRLFLARAYPQGEIAPAVLARLECLSARDLEALLASDQVEAGESCDGPGGRYSLRLGASHYPHVKLVIERCSGCAEFIFSVDTHDRHFLFGPEVGAETQARFEAIQKLNTLLKQDVERSWTLAGLPTFERYIRDGMAAMRASVI